MNGRTPVAAPPVDVAATPAGTVLVADLPGVSPDRLELNVEGHTLTLAARPAPLPPDEPGAGEAIPRHVEFAPAAFARSFILDAAIDADRIAADLTDGVLTVTLPRRDEPRSRTVAVSGGPSRTAPGSI